MGTPSLPLRTPLVLRSTLRTPSKTPLEYPLEYPPDHPTWTESGPRTSVGARPHVVEVAAKGGAAADDVDGAGGGVDHGRVPKSRSPRRAGRAARPVDTCGRTRASPAGRTESNRARGRNARRGPSYKYRKPPPCDGRTRTAPLATHTREIAIRWNRTNTHMRSQRHAYAHARTARANGHNHTHEHTRKHTRSLLAHARAPKTHVEDPAHPRYPLVPLFYPLEYPLGTPWDPH